MYLLAEVCGYVEDAEAVAAALYPRLLPIADQVGTMIVLVGCYGSMHFPAGLLASCLRRWEEAERHFEGALATNERLEARPWVVRTRRGWAAMLLDRDAPGDRERAAELVAAAAPRPSSSAWRARSCASTGCARDSKAVKSLDHGSQEGARPPEASAKEEPFALTLSGASHTVYSVGQDESGSGPQQSSDRRARRSIP